MTRQASGRSRLRRGASVGSSEGPVPVILMRHDVVSAAFHLLPWSLVARDDERNFRPALTCRYSKLGRSRELGDLPGSEWPARKGMHPSCASYGILPFANAQGVHVLPDRIQPGSAVACPSWMEALFCVLMCIAALVSLHTLSASASRRSSSGTCQWSGSIPSAQAAPWGERQARGEPRGAACRRTLQCHGWPKAR